MTTASAQRIYRRLVAREPRAWNAITQARALAHSNPHAARFLAEVREVHAQRMTSRTPWTDHGWRQANPNEAWRWDRAFRRQHPEMRYKWDRTFRAEHPEQVPFGYSDPYEGDPSESPVPGIVAEPSSNTPQEKAKKIVLLMRAHDPRARRAIALLNRRVRQGNASAQVILDYVRQIVAATAHPAALAPPNPATDTSPPVDVPADTPAATSGAYRPAPPTGRGGGGGYRPAPPTGRGSYPRGPLPLPPTRGYVPAPAWGGTPVYGLGGNPGASHMSDRTLNAIEALSGPSPSDGSPQIDASAPDASSTDAATPPADASSSGRRGWGGGGAHRMWGGNRSPFRSRGGWHGSYANFYGSDPNAIDLSMVDPSAFLDPSDPSAMDDSGRHHWRQPDQDNDMDGADRGRRHHHHQGMGIPGGDDGQAPGPSPGQGPWARRGRRHHHHQGMGIPGGDDGQAPPVMNSTGLGGYGMGMPASWNRGWGGASRGFGRWGGIHQGAHVPVYNPGPQLGSVDARIGADKGQRMPGWQLPVHSAQFALRALGFYSGFVDGAYSDDLGEAVTAYQRSIGLPPNGVVAGPTAALLRKQLPSFMASSGSYFPLESEDVFVHDADLGSMPTSWGGRMNVAVGAYRDGHSHDNYGRRPIDWDPESAALHQMDMGEMYLPDGSRMNVATGGPSNLVIVSKPKPITPAPSSYYTDGSSDGDSSSGWILPALGGALGMLGLEHAADKVFPGWRKRLRSPFASGWNGTETPFHLGGGRLPSSEKGVDCSVRMVKEGSTWRAVATCSTPQGPFRIEAVADEKALLAAGVPLPAVSDATATAAKTAVLNKVGCMNWGARRYEEALFERLKRGETAAFALVNRLKVYEKTNPKAAKILRRLRELRVQSLQGSPSSSGWPWPTKVGAGIDLDSQPRPRKNLSSHTLFRLQSAMKRAV